MAMCRFRTPLRFDGWVLVGCTRLTPHTRFSHCADSWNFRVTKMKIFLKKIPCRICIRIHWRSARRAWNSVVSVWHVWREQATPWKQLSASPHRVCVLPPSVEERERERERDRERERWGMCSVVWGDTCFSTLSCVLRRRGRLVVWVHFARMWETKRYTHWRPPLQLLKYVLNLNL